MKHFLFFTVIRVGSISANRSSENISELGCFAEPFAYCFDVDPTNTLGELLENLKSDSLEIQKHSVASWTEILSNFAHNSAHHDRPNSTVSPFQILVNTNPVSKFPQHQLFNADFIDNLPPTYVASLFDLVIQIDKQCHKFLSLRLDYSSSLDPALLDDFAARLENIIISVFSIPHGSWNVPIAKLNLCLEHERFNQEKLLSNENICLNSKCPHILTRLRLALECYPSSIALKFGQTTMTYSQLFQQATRLSDILRSHGCTSGQVIAVIMNQNINWIVAMIGIMLGGFCYFGVATDLPPLRKQNLLIQAEAAMVLVDSETDILNDKCFLNDRIFSENGNTFPQLELGQQGHDFLYCVSTSGSSGNPKVVRITHSNFTAFVSEFVQVIQTNTSSQRNQAVVWQLANVSFDAHILEVLCTLLTHSTLILCPRNWVVDHDKTTQLILDEQISHILMVPSFAESIFEWLQSNSQQSRLESLKCLFLGGERLDAKLLKQIKNQISAEARIYNLYGPAECTIVSTMHECTDLDCDETSDETFPSVPIGLPLRHYSCAVLDAWLRPVPLHAVGELYIGGAGVFGGYLGRADLSSAAFVDASHVDECLRRAYRTGDLVRQLSSGSLVFVGRADSQVIDSIFVPELFLNDSFEIIVFDVSCIHMFRSRFAASASSWARSSTQSIVTIKSSRRWWSNTQTALATTSLSLMLSC
jgi:amino acid adenylation domain-containing protein